jgi:hypothetical protein
MGHPARSALRKNKQQRQESIDKVTFTDEDTARVHAPADAPRLRLVPFLSYFLPPRKLRNQALEKVEITEKGCG